MSEKHNCPNSSGTGLQKGIQELRLQAKTGKGPCGTQQGKAYYEKKRPCKSGRQQGCSPY